jgi:hypothetical protein
MYNIVRYLLGALYASSMGDLTGRNIYATKSTLLLFVRIIIPLHFPPPVTSH